MNPLQLAVVVIALSFGTSLAADTEFEDAIPMELAEVLFDTSLNGQLEIYSDINSDFPAFDLPDGFTVLGSVIQNGSSRVVLSTTRDQDDAVQSLTAAFAQNDWIEFPMFNPRIQQTGFVSATQLPVINRSSISLCHDDIGNLAVYYSARDSGNYLALTTRNSFGGNQGNCANQIAQQERGMQQMNLSQGLRDYMPRMEVPESDSPSPGGPFLMGGGSSTSNNSAETDMNVKSDMDLEALFDHFVEQINARGWEIDSEVVGSLSATGNWTKSPEPDLDLVGTLTVLRTSESNYELRFRLIADGATGGIGGIGGTIQGIRAN